MTKRFTASSFFTGIGGLDLAAIAAGFDIISMSEVDSYASQVLSHRFPDVPNLGDIHDINKENIPGHPDIIFGGFPCQDISIAGTGKGLAGSRSGLYFELARIISEVRPQLVILENVSAIFHRGGTAVTASLTEIGYSSFWYAVPASVFGSPQHRTRWFLLGYSDSIGRQKPQSYQFKGAEIRTCSTGQPRRQCSPTESACQSSGAVRRKRHSGFRNESRVGRKPHGVSFGVDIQLHDFPAGSWKPQKAHEPPRLQKPRTGRAGRVKALGNAVVPQQALPIFEAAHEFLTMYDRDSE